ncbi:MAG: efflux RND transporter permease subunit [Gorillibacterium sp.]|nr:efflux RND transporter permease subunit [Gorillibacterium sp.]
MSFFTKFSLKNPAAVILLSLLIAIGGVYATGQFKQEQLPDIAFPGLGVVTLYPGAAPNEVLNTVTLPMEKTLRNIEGVKNVTSQSSNSVSYFSLEFGYSADMKEKAREVEEALNSVKLPQGVEKPEVQRFSTGGQAIIYSSVYLQDGVPEQEMASIVKDRVVPAIQGLEGVAKVEVLGLQEDGAFIELDARKMALHQITYQQVAQVLEANHVNVPLGEITLEKVKQPVFMNGGVETLDDVKNLFLTPDVRIRDIAEITRGNELSVISRTDNKAGVTLNIFKTTDANTVEVSDHVMAAYDEIIKEGKLGVAVQYDRATDVKESVSSMLREGGLGALFASIIILFFLRNSRATLIAVVSIPLSLLVAIISLKFFTNVTFNMMTLGGMAVATGRVVDDSIVVIENIVRRLQKEKISKDLILSATKEVGTAITASTVTTVAVFAPMGLLGGLSGQFFRPFALAVSFSLLASLLVALTIVPLMAWGLFNKNVPKAHGESRLSRSYKKTLRWSLRHKLIVLVASILILLGSLPLFSKVGMTFLPESEYKYTFASLSMPLGTELDEVKKEAIAIDEILRSSKHVKSSQVTIGGTSDNGNQTNRASWFIGLTPESNVDDFIDEIRPDIQVPTGSTFDLIKDGGNALIAITIKGNNEQDIRQATEMVTAAVTKLDGTDNVKNNLQDGTKGVEIKVRQADAMKYGLSAAQAAMVVHPYLTESPMGKIGEGSSAISLSMALKDSSLTSAEDLGNLPLDTTGETLKLKDIADVKVVQLPSALQLKNGETFSTVTASITDKNANKVNSNLEAELKKLKLPEHVTYALGGSNEEISGMMSDMAMAMAIALGMVYIVMVIALKEARAPFAILFSLPFAAIGGVIGTTIVNEPISISSLVGFLMLIGIVVTNAIVLIERVQQQMNQGLTIREALVEAGGTRLRPILMTAIATICALLPLGLGMGTGTIISTGLAVVVIGGLALSTLLTLIIVPIMFEVLHYRRARKERREWSSEIGQVAAVPQQG